MSAPDLLVVIDPAARHDDAEAVRIARDVLCAGSPGAKVCLPETTEAAERALARRGHRRAVVVGDDHALTYAVRALHREQSAAHPVDGPANLAFVPVGPPEALELAGVLGLSTDVVTAARAVLIGAERAVGLLVDDRDALLIGGLRIPAPRAAEAPPPECEAPGVLGSLTRRAGLVRSPRRPRDAHGTPLPRLRVEADGVLLADPELPVAELSVSAVADGASAGLAEVVLRQASPARAAFVGGSRTDAPPPVRVTARTVTVSGPDMDTRTWRVAHSVLRLTVPSQTIPEQGEPKVG